MGGTCSASPATEPGAMTSARSFLVRGLLAGLFAGLVAFGVAYVVGEPSINAAIAIEEAGGLGDHHADHPTASDSSAAAEVPRVLQSTVGLLTGTLVAGVTLGGLLGVLSALALGRFGRLGVRGVSLSLAAIGFVSVSLIPFVAYPPNPPAIGHPDTIGARTALYFILLTSSIIAAVTAVLVGRELADRWGAWYGTLIAIAGYLLVTIGAMALLPSYSEVPADFPATILYEFRAASLLTQLALWATLGVALGELLHRLQRRTTVHVAEPDYAEQPS
jgi:predicted cobalt transporter CbtA